MEPITKEEERHNEKLRSVFNKKEYTEKELEEIMLTDD